MVYVSPFQGFIDRYALFYNYYTRFAVTIIRMGLFEISFKGWHYYNHAVTMICMAILISPKG